MKINQYIFRTDEKGFTLIELMIVIAIIGILAAVAIPNFIAYRDKAYCSAAEKDANSIAAALADYFAIPSHTALTDKIFLGIPGALIFSGGPGRDENLLPTTSPSFSALSGDNTAQILGPVDSITIKVLDGSGRCPDDYMNAQSDAGWNSGNQTFTKTMK